MQTPILPQGEFQTSWLGAGRPSLKNWMDTLLAVNGFNGTLLWKRPLTPGIMVDRSTMIATPDALYLADERSCKLLDPASGKLRDEIVAPAELCGGSFWKWMALDHGVLYALVGENEAPDPALRMRAWCPCNCSGLNSTGAATLAHPRSHLDLGLIGLPRLHFNHTRDEG